MSNDKRNVKQQKWSSDDQAMSLLRDINSIIGDEANAEQKRIAAELERKKKEEQELERKAEEDRKKQGEERLTRERQLQEEKERKRQEELKAQEREKKIKAGEIDPAKEEADRKAAEEDKRRQDLLALSKDKALTDAQELIRQQQAELRKLSEFSRDHFLIAPKGSLVEVTASNVGDGLTPILALFALDENQEQTLVACAGADGVANPAVCSIIADGEPLSVARYFPGDATETQILSAVMVDVASAEGTNFGFTLTPTLSNPTVLALDDTSGIDDVTQDVGGLDSQTGNTTRWAVVTVTPDVDPKTLDILSTPSAASTAVLATTLYTQSADGVFASGSDAAASAGGSTAVSVATPSEPTTFLLKNSLSGAPQSAANISVNASLTSIPVLSGANDLCLAPQVVAGSGSFVVDLFGTAANYTSTVRGPLENITSGCTDPNGTGDGLAFGWPSSTTAPDSFFSVTIPAGATLSVDATGVGTDDTLLMIANNTATLCADLVSGLGTVVCLAGDDDTIADFGGSRASYFNSTASPINAMVIIKNWGTPTADDNSNTVTFTIQ